MIPSAMASSTETALESLHHIKSTEPPEWLVPKQELSQAVRAASKLLFSSLKPYCPKSPFDQLLTEGFDVEQIWQQIDLQSQPLLSSLRRELGLFDGNDEEDEDGLENARYEDFFSRKKNKSSKEKAKSRDMLEEDSGSDDEQDVDKRKDGPSKHEKELDKLRSKIEEMEKANLDPKVWTMRGEVTAAQRQKNSALEVDLDFEHNVRPAPVITEEVTASLEDLIKTRISEGLFDDVQKARTSSSKAPREIKELDESKSKKGLAEVYEEEFVQKTDPASALLTFSDELKKEASMLFKKLCLKLDALSHFHFTPKPVVEDMSIQTNVPALAMEEIAPMAVSDAAMLAPEEVFSGKGDIKEEAELTKAERKRRRANKKRKFKAEAAKRMGKKARQMTTVGNNDEGLYCIPILPASWWQGRIVCDLVLVKRGKWHILKRERHSMHLCLAFASLEQAKQ
ncbi:U3 small nucleolar ribonucleoprotein MPP10 [Gossypium arboreum]|uniref:U3 small nucleolar ribonucleoprotein MPP10 n=1 Tax=Gossypium arboreum TaxID=29729 RepID=A0A0B0MJU9_GOSAR|nr:U3 small nucleolar ribonucleoprotein MPP10 [Gossypium arboreum]